MAACAAKGAYVPPQVEQEDNRFEQTDARVTYTVDPGLDDLMLEFECDPLALGTLSYDYGGTISEEVRKTFDLLYTDAIEFDPEFGHEADFVVGFVDAVLEYHARQQMFSYHLRLTMMIELGVVRRDEGALDTFVSQATHAR